MSRLIPNIKKVLCMTPMAPSTTAAVEETLLISLPYSLHTWLQS